MNLVIVMATMVAADIASAQCGGQSGFCRKLHVPPGVKYFFSVMQLEATAGCLYGLRRYSIPFVFAMVIQCNAFLMTLRRKNLARHHILISLYGVMLLAGFCICYREIMLQSWNSAFILMITCNTAAVLRLAPRLPMPIGIIQNKYVLWPVLHVVTERLRFHVDGAYAKVPPFLREDQLFYAALSCMTTMFALGFYSPATAKAKKSSF